jgi:TonB family protein
MKISSPSILLILLLLSGAARIDAGEPAVATDRPAEVISAVAPAYPYLMRRVDGTAEVTVLFTVNSKGTVTKASVLKSNNPEFNAAALDAIKKWTFAPATKNGNAVDIKVRQTFQFSVVDKSKTGTTPLIAAEKNHPAK